MELFGFFKAFKLTLEHWESPPSEFVEMSDSSLLQILLSLTPKIALIVINVCRLQQIYCDNCDMLG